MLRRLSLEPVSAALHAASETAQWFASAQTVREASSSRRDAPREPRQPCAREHLVTSRIVQPTSARKQALQARLRLPRPDPTAVTSRPHATPSQATVSWLRPQSGELLEMICRYGGYQRRLEHRLAACDSIAAIRSLPALM